MITKMNQKQFKKKQNKHIILVLKTGPDHPDSTVNQTDG
jgi:hypothetical protein